MNQKIVTLELRGQQPSSSAVGSLKLAQELPEQQSSLTVFELAAIIDEIHGVADPCQNSRTKYSYHAEPKTGQTLQQHHQQYLQGKYSSQTALEGLAQKFGGNCLAKRGEMITLKIYAFWSNLEIADNYKLICPVARLENKRQVQSRFRLKIKVAGASEVDFGYYVKRPSPDSPQPSFKKLFWVGGNIVDQHGRAKAIAAPAWDGGTKLYWGEEITSGFIFAEFDTIYDIWDCKLLGVWTDGKRDYTATVTGIWAGTPPELPLQVPDAETEESEPCSSFENKNDIPDLSLPGLDDDNDAGDGNGLDGSGTGAKKDCQQRIDYELRHPCTGDLIDSRTEYVSAECVDGGNPPDWKVVNYLGQGDPRFEAGRDCTGPCTAAGYEEICCRPPGHHYCMPQCLEFRSVNQGGLLPPGGMEALQAEYGDDVEIEWIYPKDGYCGEHVDRLEINACETCADVPELVWDIDNPEIIAPNSHVDIEVNGGVLPILWEITAGTGYAFDNGLQKITAGFIVALNAGYSPCGKAEVLASDACSEVSGSIDPTNKILLDTHSVNLLPGSSVYISVSEGTPPYDWSLSGDIAITSGGTGYYWAYVRLNSNACSGGSVMVTDNCSFTDNCDINNINLSMALDKHSVTLSLGQTTLLQISGGIAPYDWSLSGDIAITSGGTGYNWAYVRLNSNACSGGSVTVTDGCSSTDNCNINNANPSMALDKHSVFLSIGQSVLLQISGGIAPYVWSVSGDVSIISGGNGYNWAYARLNGDNGGSVSVVDYCSTSDTCVISKA